VKATGFFETLILLNQTTRGHISEHRNIMLKFYENRSLRRIFGAKRERGSDGVGGWKKYIVRGFIICTSHQTGLLLV
jgi:hypothetical protein